MIALGLFLVPLTLAALQEPGSDEEPPGAPIGIDGIGGFHAESVVEFEGVEDDPHALSFTYHFPDRARWRVNSIRGNPTARSLYFRFGGRAWKIEGGSKDSVEFLGGERDRTLVQMELRRALMHYPHGFTWLVEEGGRAAEVRRSTSGKNGPVIGRLLVSLVDDRPVRMTGFDSRDQEIETLEVTSWQTIRKRRWPAGLRLSQGDRTIWSERVEVVDAHASYVDRYFQPPDERDQLRSYEDGLLIQAVDLQPILFRGYDLPEGTEFTRALELSSEWIQAAIHELSGTATVDLVPCFELDQKARPVRCLVRLRAPLPTPPEGWKTRWDRPGVGTVLGRLDALDEHALELLRRAAPKGEDGGTPYCRIHRVAGPNGVQLYLPLKRKD